MSTLKKLASETAIYGISNIVGRSLNFLLVPFYTSSKHFAVEEYGLVTGLYAYAAFFNVVLTFGLETTYFRFCNKEGADKTYVYRSIQTILLFTTLLFLGVAYVFADKFPFARQLPNHGQLITNLALVLSIDTVLTLSFAKLRLEGRAKKFALVKLLNILLNIGLNVWFVVVMPVLHPGFLPNANHVLIANLLANLAQILFFPLDVILWFKLTFSWPISKKYLLYGFPIMIMGLAGMTNEMLDRIVLEHWLPVGFYAGLSVLAVLGIYGACYKLSIFISLGTQAFRYASEPFFFAKAKEKDSTEMYAKVMNWFVLVCCGILLLISFNLGWLQYILGRPEYRTGLAVVPILLTANLFLGMYYNLSIWYKLTDRTHYGMYISIGGAVLTLTLNLLLIPEFGYMGCAWATFICYGTMVVVSYLLGHFYYPVPYNVLFLVLSVGMCSALSITMWDEPFTTHPHLSTLYKNAFCLFVLFCIFTTGRKAKYL